MHFNQRENKVGTKQQQTIARLMKSSRFVENENLIQLCSWFRSQLAAVWLVQGHNSPHQLPRRTFHENSKAHDSAFGYRQLDYGKCKHQREDEWKDCFEDFRLLRLDVDVQRSSRRFPRPFDPSRWPRIPLRWNGNANEHERPQLDGFNPRPGEVKLAELHSSFHNLTQNFLLSTEIFSPTTFSKLHFSPPTRATLPKRCHSRLMIPTSLRASLKS